jgi:lysophospholipase L1-like esterase
MMSHHLLLDESSDSRVKKPWTTRGTGPGILVLVTVLAPTVAFNTSCGGEAPDNPAGAAAMDTLSYLALGDSYTIGESVDSIQRWPVQLALALNREGIPVREPFIIARTGWTTDELAQGIQEAGVQGPFDLVSLLIGVNNQYRGRSLEEYRLQLRELLRQAVDFAGGDPGRVLVLSIPDWGVTPFAEGRDREAIGQEIDAFNAVKREESALAGTRFVDVTGISREAAEDDDLVAPDGLHPSGAMYARWVQVALPATESMVAGDSGSGG